MAETVEWIDANGASTVLQGVTSRHITWNISGRFAPPVRFEEEGIPEQDGLRLRATRYGAREFMLPVWVKASTESELRTSLRSLVKSMNPKRGDGKIRVTSPLGDQREIVCRVSDGLGVIERLGDTSTDIAQQLALTFRAWNPYWQAVSDTSDTYVLGDPAPFFPIFPLRLSSSTVFADASPDNIGDVEAWPVWTIAGPGSSIVLRNLTTGYSMTLSTALGSGETLTIDSRPGVKTVTKGDGTNLFTDLSSASCLWPLDEGVNSVRVEMSAATAASSVTLAFRPNFLSP